MIINNYINRYELMRLYSDAIKKSKVVSKEGILSYYKNLKIKNSPEGDDIRVLDSRYFTKCFALSITETDYFSTEYDFGNYLLYPASTVTSGYDLNVLLMIYI